MANEITFGYTTGRTLTYGVYQPDGTVRTAAGTALSETAGTGYYTASDANIVAGDWVIVKDSVLGVVGAGEYKTEISATAIEAKIDVIDGIVDDILVDTGTTLDDHLTDIKGTGFVKDTNSLVNITDDQSKVLNIYNEIPKSERTETLEVG